MPVERLAIVGTGLIGASVALAAKQAGVESVSGFDPDSHALEVAAERAGSRPARLVARGGALADAELAVVAAPVTQIAAQVALRSTRAPRPAR